jgi:hypothetical protein
LSLTHRILPPHEWDKLLAYEPFRSHGLPEAPDHWRVCVVEDGDQIVGLSCIFTAVHWDIWEIRPEYQKNPAVVKGLITEGLALLKDTGVTGVFAVVDNHQPESHHALMKHFGFTEATGVLYSANIADLPEVE